MKSRCRKHTWRTEGTLGIKNRGDECLGNTDIVQEPDDADSEQPEAVVTEDEQIGSLASHGVLGELLGLLEPETENKENQGENDTDSERGPPDGAQVPIVGGSGDNVWRESVSSQYQ